MEQKNLTLEEVTAKVQREPAHQQMGEALQTCTRGLLLFFLTGDQRGDSGSRQTILADLTAVHDSLAAAGVQILAITPELTDAGFEIPFPHLQVPSENKLVNEIWDQLQPGAGAIKNLAVFIDAEGDGIKKKWEKFEAEALVTEILVYLVQKNFLIHIPGTDIVQVLEKDHLKQRRKKTAEETHATLDVQDPGSKSVQAQAFDALIKADEPSAPIGLAFSGGGIRAATFNLGIIQALARLRLLPWVDYLSTVSGGGFIGSALVSLLSRRSSRRAHFFSTQWEKFPFNPGIEAFKSKIDLDKDPDQRENRNFRDVSHKKGHNNQLAYLIKNGNYLVPRLGLATRDLMRGVGTLLSGTGFTLLLFVLAMFGLACLHYFAASTTAPAVLQNIDMTRIDAGSAQTLEVNVALDGDAQTIVLVGDEAGGEDPSDQEAAGPAFSLAYLLFGHYQVAPPLLEPGADQAEAGQFPWPIYLIVLLSGVIASFMAYHFIEETYRFPLPGQNTKKETRDKSESKIPRDPINPRPKYLLWFLWPALLIGIGLFAWMLAAVFQSADFGAIVYPLALLAVGLLLGLLLKGVPEKGTIDSNRWLVVFYLVVLGGLGYALTRTDIQFQQAAMSTGIFTWVWLPLVIGLLTGIILAIYHRNPEKDRWGKHGFDRWEWYDPFALRMVLGFLVAVMVLVLSALQEFSGIQGGTDVFWLWQPAVYFSGSLLFMVAIRLFIKGKKPAWGSSRFRTMIWAFSGLNLYGLIAAVFFATLAIPQVLAIGGEEPASAAVPLGTAIISGLWAAFLTQFTGKDTSGENSLKKIFALPAGIRNFVLGFLVVVLWISMVFLFETWLDQTIVSPLQALGYGALAVAVFIALGSLQNFNYLSPHYFFGDQAAEVFMKTEVEMPDGRVATVRADTRYKLVAISPESSSAPYHLVVAAVNMAGSGHQQDRDRKSRHFIFSKLFVGSEATGYVRSKVYRGGKTSYGSTIALSGAAASPGLGTFTFFAQAFMMTLLNIRLGLWWVNPREYKGVDAKEKLDMIHGFEDQAFWPLYLMDEALAKTSERRHLVNITDGGHTRDNGGLYPLFERRCKVIIAGDASHDSEGLCHDLFSVMHYVNVDLDIKVDIDVSRLQPAKQRKNNLEAGMSEAHIAIGKITYPAVYRPDGTEKYPQENGWLVYIKPAISKAMPSEVLQFWQTDKEMFPHPTTADQFFTERQFEAQRRLGEESVLISLQSLLAAYQGPETTLKDPRKQKQQLLQGMLENQHIDYLKLKNKPNLFDEIMQDWMTTISPLGNEGG